MSNLIVKYEGIINEWLVLACISFFLSLFGAYSQTFGPNLSANSYYAEVEKEIAAHPELLEKKLTEALGEFGSGLKYHESDMHLLYLHHVDEYKNRHRIIIFITYPCLILSFWFLCLWFLMYRVVRMLKRFERVTKANNTQDSPAGLIDNVTSESASWLNDSMFITVLNWFINIMKGLINYVKQLSLYKRPLVIKQQPIIHNVKKAKSSDAWLCVSCNLPNTSADKECFKCGTLRKD